MEKLKQEEQPKNENNTEGATPADLSEEPKTAFFITPLGGDSSEIRRATDGLIDAVIEPTLKQFNIILVPPHKIKNPGNITRQVVRHILESDLVIANLTGLNANAMYELAIRHAKRKPVIVIAEKGTILPFDIAAERTIFYQNDMGGAVELMARLHETIPVALTDNNPENPIYSGLESSIIQEKASQGDDPVQIYLLEKIEQLADSVSAIKSSVLSTSDSDSYFVHPRSTGFEITLVLKRGTPEQYKALRSYISRLIPTATFKTTPNGLAVFLRSAMDVEEVREMYYQSIKDGFDLDKIDTSSYSYGA